MKRGMRLPQVFVIYGSAVTADIAYRRILRTGRFSSGLAPKR